MRCKMDGYLIYLKAWIYKGIGRSNQNKLKYPDALV